ncbi:MAG: hypothetical protein RSA52_02820 [Acetivibrio sp.]
MKQLSMDKDKMEVEKICDLVRHLVSDGNYETCEEILSNMMGKHPHAPEPHNLFGVLYEKEGKYSEAMKHFRAAWALDPTYLPARFNMELYTSFDTDFAIKGKAAFDEEDCPEIQEGKK